MQKRQVLRDGASIAGFRRVELLEDSLAVALALTKQGQDIGRGMLKYDLGTQMFELPVVARETEDSPFHMLVEPQGDPDFGAQDLALTLYDYFDGIAVKKLGRHISLTEGVRDLVFLRQCRRLQENLSYSRTARLSAYLPSKSGPQRFRHEIHRETFEDLIQPRIEGTVNMTVELWEQVKDQVDTVVLMGGASRIPLVRQRLEEALQVEPRSIAEMDYVVALGAAYKAYEVWIEEAWHHHG